MYAKHFFKMLVALMVMAVVGLAGLIIANHLSKAKPDEGSTPTSSIVAPTSASPASAGDTRVKMKSL